MLEWFESVKPILPEVYKSTIPLAFMIHYGRKFFRRLLSEEPLMEGEVNPLGVAAEAIIVAAASPIVVPVESLATLGRLIRR